MKKIFYDNTSKRKIYNFILVLLNIQAKMKNISEIFAFSNDCLVLVTVSDLNSKLSM